MLIADQQSPIFSVTDSAGLAEFLSGIGALIKRHTVATWVRAEISRLQDRNHLFIELVEHDDKGIEIAKCSARVWARSKDALLAKFKSGTGALLEEGMKVLLQVEASFHAQYGFALTIQDIDPSYTLGDMERKLQEIRQRLIDENLYTRNRERTAPADFTRVAVISPENAAGLGDFRIQADRLQEAGLCAFDYFSATFQGLTASDSILTVLRKVYAGQAKLAGNGYDALVIIRGGGAVTDLAWLNDYQLARGVCCMNMPVFTGIGHQQDNTILDEVAQTRFDTPSKVIGHIINLIADRARCAREDWQCIQLEAQRMLTLTEQRLHTAHEWLTARMLERVSQARALAESCMTAVNQCAGETVRLADAGLNAGFKEIELRARASINEARAQTLLSYREIATSSKQAVLTKRSDINALYQGIGMQGHNHILRARTDSRMALDVVADIATTSVRWARREVEYRMAEVIGLGPQHTLARGYSIVRNPAGRVMARVEEASQESRLTIQFANGTLSVRVEDSEEGKSNE